jgi:Polyketide cyclase / dehydrase and lipid transport
MPDIVEVSTTVAATPERLYELVADLPGMGRWSPECAGGAWIGGATGARVGARFKGKNENGGKRWQTVSTVIVAEPGREVAWESKAFGLPVAVWRYRFASGADGGTEVTESTEDRRGVFLRVFGATATGVSDRRTHNAETMRVTLEQLKTAAEGSPSGP